MIPSIWISPSSSGGVSSSTSTIALMMMVVMSAIASCISTALTSIARGSPRRESLPLRRKVLFSSASTAQAIASLQERAIALPMIRPCLRRTYLMISSSILLPAVLMVLPTDIPPSDKTAISTVPAPMSTIITPWGDMISLPLPNAAALAASISRTRLTPKLEIAPTIARFSTSVISPGIHATTRGMTTRLVQTSAMKMLTSSSTSPDSAITPPSSGNTTLILAEVLPSIS